MGVMIAASFWLMNAVEIEIYTLYIPFFVGGRDRWRWTFAMKFYSFQSPLGCVVLLFSLSLEKGKAEEKARKPHIQMNE